MWPFRRRKVGGRLDERFLLYVQRELPGRLGVSPSSSGGLAVGQFARGRSAYVRHVELPGCGKVVVRAYFRRRQLRCLAGYRELFATLAAQRIAAPRLLFVDDSAATLRTYGFWVLGEEFVEGEAFADLPVEAQDALVVPAGELLARLHGIRHPAAGKPWEGEEWEPGSRARRVLGEWLARTAAVVPELGRGRRRRLAAWFAAQLRARGRTQFPLVHGDLNQTNLLLGRDGRLRVVDLEHCAHWFPEHDLVVVERSVCREDAGQIEALLSRYFAAAGDDAALSRQGYGELRPLFSAWYHVRAAASRARRVQRGRRTGEPGWEQSLATAREHWASAEAFLAQAGAP